MTDIIDNSVTTCLSEESYGAINTLEVRNVNKSLSGRHIIKDESFDVRAGEVLGFIGPNGAGKTTTIKMITGFLSEDTGSIRINGFDHVKDYEKAMECIGAIVENPEMYTKLSGRKNIEMYARLHGITDSERISEVIALVGMTAWADEKIKRYSLGMKQRMGLAQALVHRPRLLILDEPTNGLDPEGIKELRTILRKLAHEEGVAVMVSSHQLAEMDLMCDRILIISKGRIISENTIEELHNLCGKDKYAISVADRDKAIGVIGESGREEIIISGDTESKEILVSIGEDEIPVLIKELALADVPVLGFTKKQSSLEEAYLRILNGENTDAR